MLPSVSAWSPTPGFPAQYKAGAEDGAAFLDRLRLKKEPNWTFLSPSALFVAGMRTGKFRLGPAPDRGRGQRHRSRTLPRAGRRNRAPAPPGGRFAVGYRGQADASA
jgi:hypothetical protein